MVDAAVVRSVVEPSQGGGVAAGAQPRPLTSGHLLLDIPSAPGVAGTRTHAHLLVRNDAGGEPSS